MDFDDHDDGDEDMVLAPVAAVGSTYDNTPTCAAVKVSGGEPAPGGSGHRKASGGGGGGRYRECLKNHAVSIGAHAVDGCGEFMAAGEEGTLDALRCAACSCHRNFHRKEAAEGGEVVPAGAGAGGFHLQFSPYYRTPAGYLNHHHHHQMAAAAQRAAAPQLALPSTSGGGQSGEEDVSNAMMGCHVGGASGSGSGKKRFRTKFTQEQKDKMLAFAEGVGWRIQKHDEAAVQQFCQETCVKRHVLKVWMHNNKHTLGKKP